jgi:hypothetical protein
VQYRDRGVTGCLPVLFVWAAVKGTMAIPAIILFAVTSLRTSPHFWALAMKYHDGVDKNAPAVAGGSPGIRGIRTHGGPPPPPKSALTAYALIGALDLARRDGL